MIITEELRNKILLHLPDDYQKQGSEATGYSKSMVYKVLHEGHSNDAIAEWLTHTALKAKREKEKNQNKLAQIAKQL
jgi:hypothetical protein